MTADDAATVGVYFGTTSGEVWGSTRRGTHVEMPRPAFAGDLRGRVGLAPSMHEGVAWGNEA